MGTPYKNIRLDLFWFRKFKTLILLVFTLSSLELFTFSSLQLALASNLETPLFRRASTPISRSQCSERFIHRTFPATADVLNSFAQLILTYSQSPEFLRFYSPSSQVVFKKIILEIPELAAAFAERSASKTSKNQKSAQSRRRPAPYQEPQISELVAQHLLSIEQILIDLEESPKMSVERSLEIAQFLAKGQKSSQDSIRGLANAVIYWHDRMQVGLSSAVMESLTSVVTYLVDRPEDVFAEQDSLGKWVEHKLIQFPTIQTQCRSVSEMLIAVIAHSFLDPQSNLLSEVELKRRQRLTGLIYNIYKSAVFTDNPVLDEVESVKKVWDLSAYFTDIDAAEDLSSISASLNWQFLRFFYESTLDDTFNRIGFVKALKSLNIEFSKNKRRTGNIGIEDFGNSDTLAAHHPTLSAKLLANRNDGSIDSWIDIINLTDSASAIKNRSEDSRYMQCAILSGAMMRVARNISLQGNFGFLSASLSAADKEENHLVLRKVTSLDHLGHLNKSYLAFSSSASNQNGINLENSPNLSFINHLFENAQFWSAFSQNRMRFWSMFH